MRQLSCAFLQAGRHIASTPPSSWPVANGVAMCRIDSARNMAWFYSRDVARDLFARVVLVRRWDRIGTAGKVSLDEHTGEGKAFTALQRLQNAKRRRGYQFTRQP